MPSGHLSVRHNFTGETQYVIAQWVKSTAPLTEIGRHVYAAPHSEQSLLIEDLQPVWHLVRFWRSSDGVALDQEILTLAGNARSGAVYPITRYEYIVGRGGGGTDPTWNDPAPDETQLMDERLAGKFFWIEERGTGSLLSSEINVLSEGGFEFVDEFKVFNDGAVYIATVVERVDITEGDTPVDSDTIIVETDIDYDHTIHNGKTLVIQGSADVLTISIPNLTLVADSSFRVVTHEGTQRNCVIQFDTGDTIIISQNPENSVIMGVAEEVVIEFIDNVPYITNGFNYDHIGRVIHEWSTADLPNKLKLSGQTIDLTNYPRVVWLLENRITPISTAAWDLLTTTSKGYWGRTGNNVRVPLLVDFVRAGTTPGAYQVDTIGPHTHPFNPTDQTGRSDNANDRDVKIPGTSSLTTGSNNDAGDQTQPRHIDLTAYITI
jgi:hypothetical protein